VNKICRQIVGKTKKAANGDLYKLLFFAPPAGQLSNQILADLQDFSCFKII